MPEVNRSVPGRRGEHPAAQISFAELLFTSPDTISDGAADADTARHEKEPDEALSTKPPQETAGGSHPKTAPETPKRDEAQRRVEEGLKALAGELEAGNSATLVRWLQTMSRFHQYSLNNTLLIAWQRPDATYVAGFHTWKSLGRSVKKGEKGIFILAPILRQTASRKGRSEAAGADKREEGEAAGDERPKSAARGGVLGFRGAYVFDISQTEGKDLPSFATVQGDPDKHLERLKKLIADEGVGFAYASSLQGAFGRSLKGRIEVLRGLTPAHEFSVLVHELAHELLHKEAHRRAETTKTVRETEAEAVSFVVCRAIGLDSSSQHADYIRLYQGTVEILTASLEAIRSTSARILSVIKSPAQKVVLPNASAEAA